MSLTRSLCLLAVLLAESALAPACVMEQPLEQSSAQVIRPNGKRLNGKRLNGKRLNGKRLNGTVLGGHAITGLRAVGGQLVADLAGGQTALGAALVGTTVAGTLTNGEEISLQLGNVELDAFGTISLYHFSMWTAAEGWDDACEGGVGARVLNGYWDESEGTATGGDHVDDPDVFTLACEGFALAKCVEMGYWPWAGLGSYHQACTRMLRADYCGDGTPHTEDGTEINVWDAADIQTRDPLPWVFEAEWSDDGANCISRTRLEQTDYCLDDYGYCLVPTVQAYVEQTCPERASWAIQAGNCGPDFPSIYGDTYLMDQMNPGMTFPDRHGEGDWEES